MHGIVISLVVKLLDKPVKLKIIQNFTLNYGNMICLFFLMITGRLVLYIHNPAWSW